MPLRIYITLFIGFLSAPLIAEEELPIQRLGWLIGEWETRDEQVKGDYTETGPRNCEWGLNDRYIVCRGVGTNHKSAKRGRIGLAWACACLEGRTHSGIEGH